MTGCRKNLEVGLRLLGARRIDLIGLIEKMRPEVVLLL